MKITLKLEADSMSAIANACGTIIDILSQTIALNDADIAALPAGVTGELVIENKLDVKFNGPPIMPF